MKLLQRREKTSRKFPGLVEYLDGKLGMSKGSGAERHYHCPFCIDLVGSESSKQKLDVNIMNGKARCYRCGYKAGNLESLLRKLNKGVLTIVEQALIRGVITRDVSTSLVSAVRGIITNNHADDVRGVKPIELPKEFRLVSEIANTVAGKVAVNYLRKRGAEPELWDQFQIGYAATGRYEHRLIFPVFQGGEVVYFTTRYCGQHDLKSLNPPATPGYVSRDDVLFNYDACVGEKRIAMAEGPFSVMAFGDPALECPAAATFGKVFSDAQLILISELVTQGLEELVVAYDPDAGKAIDSLMASLEGVVPIVTSLKIDRGDPWDRRADLPELLKNRGVPSMQDRVRGRLVKSK
jgi:hypothetical protein